MDTASTPNSEVIDLRIVARQLWAHKARFIKVWVVTFVLACVYILPQPRGYVSTLSLAPETGGTSAAGALAGIASSFCFNLGDNEMGDAFYPELYPDLVSSNRFIVDLLYIPVQTADGAVDTTYLQYMLRHQQKNPYLYPFLWTLQKAKSLFEEPLPPVSAARRLDPKRLNRREDQLVNKVRQLISCDVDIKTNVITLVVKDQDPLVCVTVADSVRERLQEFITSYRTSKARIDVDYYTHLLDSAMSDYRVAVARYDRFCDTHQNAVRQQYVSQRNEMENDLQNRLSTVGALQAQLQAAKAKVQERTPAFTVLQDASMPVKATSPKRMIFVAAMLFLATIGTIVHLYRKELVAQLLGSPAPPAN